MKKTLYAVLWVVFVYIAVFAYCKMNLWDVEHYRSIVLWTVYFVGCINFCVALANPLAGTISAAAYPVIVYIANLYAQTNKEGNGIALYSCIAVLVVTSVIAHKLKLNKR